MPSLFTTQTPASPAANDGTPYELGMKFMVAKAGVISAIRFYKSAGDSAFHIGHIWSPTGTLLASVMFSGETASGWQEQVLATPLKVQANTIYTVSVNIGTTFPVTQNAFQAALSTATRGTCRRQRRVWQPWSVPAGYFHSSIYFRDIVFAADVVVNPAVSLVTAINVAGMARLRRIQLLACLI